MENKKIFYLGFGGQKCGSSWYQAYLARQIGSDFGRLDEYQIWEYELGFPFDRYQINSPSLTKKIISGVKWSFNRSVSNGYMKWRMQNNKEEYFNYFAKILANPKVCRSGDVTPSYAALPENTIRKIKYGFDIRNINTRAIFSMRDPVARIRSHFNMNQQKGYIQSSGDYIQDLKKFYTSLEAQTRMRYDRTIESLESVFLPEDLHICLFEEMVTPEGVASFANFAEIEYDATACDQKVNTRDSVKINLPQELEQEISRHYQEVYEKVYKQFPQILTFWPSTKYIL